MNKIKSFEQLINKQREINQVINIFYKLGIDILPTSEIRFNWQKCDNINNKVNSLDFFDQLTFTEKLALSIALNEEESNGFVDNSDISEVNQFFNVKVTRDLICQMNKKFV